MRIISFGLRTLFLLFFLSASICDFQCAAQDKTTKDQPTWPVVFPNDTAVYFIERDILFASIYKKRGNIYEEKNDYSCYFLEEKSKFDDDVASGRLKYNLAFQSVASSHWQGKTFSDGQLKNDDFRWLERIIVDEFFRVITWKEKRRLNHSKTGLIVVMIVDNHGVPRLVLLQAYSPLKGRISRKSFLEFHSFVKSLRFYPSYDTDGEDEYCIYTFPLTHRL